MRTLLLATMTVFAAGCAPSDASNSPIRRYGSVTTAGSAAGAAPSSHTAGTFSAGNPGAPLLGPAPSPTAGSPAPPSLRDASVADVPLTSESSCGKGSAEAEPKPVNMFVMFDRSGSMEDDDKWSNASAALTAFFRDSALAGMRVALRFFPHDSPVAGCTEDGCDAAACSQPLVPIAPLTAADAPTDTQEAALVSAVASAAPGGARAGGGTPIYAALDGALRWATDYQVTHPDETTVVVFVTDGEPNGCEEGFAQIAALAATALQNNGVTTYAIGLKGSSTAQMDQLAQAGGTARGIYVDTGASATTQLVAALNAIRQSAIACDFPMPQPSDATMQIDPSKVNVTFTPSGGKAGTLAQVLDQASCATNKAWYYDAPQLPTRIHLCPAACDLVRKDAKALLEFLLGCHSCGGLDVSCGGEPPPPEVPPILL